MAKFMVIRTIPQTIQTVPKIIHYFVNHNQIIIPLPQMIKYPQNSYV